MRRAQPNTSGVGFIYVDKPLWFRICLPNRLDIPNSMVVLVGQNWGDVASAISVVVSLVALGWAIYQSHKARSVSDAAHEAAQGARNDVVRYSRVVGLERAIALIQYIKGLHRMDLWGVALVQYQSLRMMISEVAARLPEDEAAFLDRLHSARGVVTQMEHLVDTQPMDSLEFQDRAWILGQLNDIQSNLEELASRMLFSES